MMQIKEQNRVKQTEDLTSSSPEVAGTGCGALREPKGSTNCSFSMFSGRPTEF